MGEGGGGVGGGVYIHPCSTIFDVDISLCIVVVTIRELIGHNNKPVLHLL